VTIDSGPVEAEDQLRNMPRERWRSLMLVRRRFLAIRLPHDCRSLLQFVEDAEQMHEACGFASVENYIRGGLGFDPVQVNWALDGLRRMKPDEAVGYNRAIEIGKADAEDRANQRPAHVHIKRDVDNNETDIHVRPSGISRAAALRRLRKDRPDIHARVLAGELSPHAGMIEAGFRKRTVRRKSTAFDHIMRLLPKLSVIERTMVHNATALPAGVPSVISCPAAPLGDGAFAPGAPLVS
jgi:hypothetical protein